jgi:hypothetical protein
VGYVSTATLLWLRPNLLMYRQPLWEFVADLLGGLVHQIFREQLSHYAVDHLYRSTYYSAMPYFIALVKIGSDLVVVLFLA